MIFIIAAGFYFYSMLLRSRVLWLSLLQRDFIPSKATDQYNSHPSFYANTVEGK